LIPKSIQDMDLTFTMTMLMENTFLLS